ncbi:hypothetical protein CPC16_008047 [Podila verticillata]|nr:hypothetical protein CPC16_008047 [Podila verticillata]
MQATATWHPIQIPQRSQNMSRTSNHSNQSVTNLHADEDEDTQLLLTVEHAIVAARRLVQSLTETCMTRFESQLTSPQLRPTHRNRSVSASPPRSSGSSGSSHSSSHNNNSSNGSNGSAKTVQDEQGRSLTMSPLQLSTDTSAGSGAPSSAATSTSTSDSNPTLIRSPLFSNSADSVPYSNGMCLSLPIDKGPPNAVTKTTTTTTTVTTTEITTLTPSTGPTTSAGQNENPLARTERRSTTGSHSKGSSRTYDPALPSIPQNETSESGPSPKSQVSSTTPGGMAVTSRSASVSVGSSGGYVPSNHGTLSSSSLPTPGFLSGHGAHPHFQLSHPPPHLQPGTPGQYSSSSVTYPFAAGNTLNLPASQLWREMRDCLLQMTEIVKRLDLDLSMIRAEDHHPLHHPQHHHPVHHHPAAAYHHPQQTPTHHHPHHGREGPHPYQHGTAPLYTHSGPSESESNTLRRRFGMGISDFVKSVVVISTLVRQLSSTGSRSGTGVGVGSGSGSGSFIMVPADVSTTISSSTTTATTISISATPRVGSAGSGESNHLSTPITGSTNRPLSESSPESKMSSMSASSSATGIAFTASPEKTLGSSSSHAPSHPHHHPLTRFQSQPSLLPLGQQQQQQQPEIFSRLVTTNVSNLTKITKELTMRMPRSSFRDLMLPQSSPSIHPINTSSSSTSLSSSFTPGPSSIGGGWSMIHPNSYAGAGISGASSNGTGGGYGSGSGYSYGPAGATILALRKGSLI